MVVDRARARGKNVGDLFVALTLNHEVGKYTFPIIVLQRLFDGTVVGNCGTFIVVNKEGWALTAAHIIAPVQQAEANLPIVKKYLGDRKAIENTQGLSLKEKQKKIKRLISNPSWVTHHCVALIGHEGTFKQMQRYPVQDIAVGRIERFDPSKVQQYPIFKNPLEPMPMGTPLCRLGFPFGVVEAGFDEAKEEFRFDRGNLPFFPNDGIHTRIVPGKPKDGKSEAKYLETSTPGVPGQSGGPIFDLNGHVWALQSQTLHLPLFTVTAKDKKKEFTELQFMNLGLGSHVEEIIKVFQAHRVDFQASR